MEESESFLMSFMVDMLNVQQERKKEFAEQ